MRQSSGAFAWGAKGARFNLRWTTDGGGRNFGRVTGTSKNKASANLAVAGRWTEYRAKFSVEYPDLLLFLEEAANYPKITSLFPFLSMHRLCFSRCTRYPFFVNFIVCSKRDGKFSVEQTDGRGGWVDSTPVGLGDAKEAAKLLNELIPSDYGLAIEGTSDDLLGFWALFATRLWELQFRIKFRFWMLKGRWQRWRKAYR